MKIHPFFASVFCICCAGAYGQAAPAAFGSPHVPLNGNLQFSARYSHGAVVDPAYPEYQVSVASADLAYTSESNRHPFQLDYAGGYSWMVAGPPQVTGVFHRLFIRQGFAGKKWSGSVGNEVGYLPGSPTTGFSGVPGIGEPIGQPNPLPNGSQNILTANTHTLNEVVTGSAERRLNHMFSLAGGIAWELLRYPNGDGADTDSLSGDVGLVSRLSARNSLEAQFQTSRFTYPDSNFMVQSRSGMLGVKHVFNSKFSAEAAAGPEWVGGTGESPLPSSIGISAHGLLNYYYRHLSSGLSYARGINGGSGYLPGARTDTVEGYLSNEFGKTWTLGMSGAFMHNTPLWSQESTINSTFWGVQAHRRLSRSMAVFGDYTIIRQTTDSALPENVIKGFRHIFGVGIEYFPRVNHLHR